MTQLHCPKCQGTLSEVVYASITVDRCTDCQGIWFDSLEAQELKEIKGSESIDVGDPQTGQKFNQTREINCPKCQTKMTKMVDLKQAHIFYEKCPVCYGMWFDAGEFKDYKEETVFETIKNFCRVR